MDRIKKYKIILEEFFKDRAAIQNRQGNNLKSHLLLNIEKTDFILVKMGWRRKLFVHAVIFYIEMKNHKVWIYEDKTDIDVAKVLVDAGVQKEDIVLGFLSPTLRAFSDYAVA